MEMLPYPTFDGFSRKVLTLTMIMKGDKILLGMKNRGMGKGKWNGFGGKVEPNETIDDAAIREVKEECGLDVISIKKIGIIEFEYVGSKELLEGHIYLCDLFSGDIIESDEMSPIKWFKIGDSPCNSMWIDHKYWFPMVLKQIPFKAHFQYLNDDTMVDNTIILLNSKCKTRETWVHVVVQKDHKVLLSKTAKELDYFNNHTPVNSKETLEEVSIRYLQKNFEVVTEKNQKVAVAYIEYIDKQYIQEINFFVADVSIEYKDGLWLDINNLPASSSWLNNKFLSTLLKKTSFKAYFIIDENNVLCSKYIYDS